MLYSREQDVTAAAAAARNPAERQCSAGRGRRLSEFTNASPMLLAITCLLSTMSYVTIHNAEFKELIAADFFKAIIDVRRADEVYFDHIERPTRWKRQLSPPLSFLPTVGGWPHSKCHIY
jgi:hypothetical protein